MVKVKANILTLLVDKLCLIIKAHIQDCWRSFCAEILDLY